MKDFKKFFVCLNIGMIAAIVAILIPAASYTASGVDIVYLNDCVQIARENWDNLAVFNEKDLKTEILILDRENQVVYSSPAFENHYTGVKSSYDALRNGMLCAAVNDDQIFVGTVIIPDSLRAGYDHTLHQIFKITCLIAGVFFFICAIFLFYVYRNLVKPFQRMKQFAGLIAQGKLDEPLILEKNNLFGIFTESFDIMREELRASRDREAFLKQREKELIASLSHDLKTPVTGIRLICELLLLKTEDEYLRGKLMNISQKTEDIHLLVNDLLSSSLEELGEMNVNCREETSDILRILVDEYDLKKRVWMQEIPDCILKIDKNRLSQVIGNILTNSYKYADTKIDIACEFNGKYLQMAIRDYGGGIEPEEIRLLTGKFYRGKNTSGKEGSGLGLYIASELMKKMGGQLICSGEPDGLLVTLMLPLA